MQSGSCFGFPSAEDSLPACISLHTNHFLNLKQSKGDEHMRQEKGIEVEKLGERNQIGIDSESDCFQSAVPRRSSPVLMNVPLCRRWCTFSPCLDNPTVYFFSAQHIPPVVHSLHVIFHHFLITHVSSSAVFPLRDLLIGLLFDIIFFTCQSQKLI